MSIQLMIAASYLPPEEVTQGQKLALMKIADSADDETRLSRPGLTRLAAWVGVSDKRAITIVTELIAKGFVERVETGKVGRAAVYRVFPLGVPPTPTTPELKAAAAARKAAPKNPRLARPGVSRPKPDKPAMTYQDVEKREAERRQRGESAQVEPGFHEGNPADSAGLREGNPEAQEPRVPPVEPGEFREGNPVGSLGETPSFPGPSSVLPFPPTPTADAVGEPAPPAAGSSEQERAASPEGCERHRGRPAASCRGCGTNPRAGRERERVRAKEAERRADSQFWEDWREGAASRRQQADAQVETAERAREEARAAVRSFKELKRQQQ
ncbi:helix-turn-helix domain-containing protein [Streptomyces sp. NPDC093111]|uniref:helix-turn-helix domain-containing protein n=1 Tax=Streptomyces sp. NPDC093111 TaxID=3154978 RepID=UPI003424BB70